MTGHFAPVRTATVVAGLTVGLEAALLAIAAILYTALWAVGESPTRDLSLGLALVCAGSAVGLALLSRGLWKARRWATAPALTWQVLQGLGAALVPAQPAVTIVGVALAVIGAIAIVIVARSVASAG